MGLVVLAAVSLVVGAGAGRDGEPGRAQSAQTDRRELEVGVVVDVTWGIPTRDIDRTVAMLQDAGADWVRANVNWADVERDGKGVYDREALTRVDYAVDALRRAGIDVLMPISDGVPYWASGDPGKSEEPGGRDWKRRHPPADVRDYADFVRFVVARYRPRGVRAYEIWNEPNLAGFWEPEPDARGFTELLRAGYAAVKAADPSATVVLGGLSTSDYDYLANVYRHGGRDHFDVLAIHPYTGGGSPRRCWRRDDGRFAKDAFCAIREVRRTMVENGDAAKQIWLTEIGWTTTTQGGGVTPERQAAYLEQSVAIVRREMPFVGMYLWYGLRNNHWEDDADTFEGQFGLLRDDFSRKPAFDAFRRASGG